MSNTEKELTDLVSDLWIKKAIEYFEQPPMFIYKKYKNKNWRWWKIFTKRYIYKMVMNPKYKSNIKFKR